MDGILDDKEIELRQSRYDYFMKKEYVERKVPGAATYERDSSLTQKTVTGPAIKARLMEEMSPSPDGRGPLHPNIDAIKKVAPSVSIAPEHDPVLSELIKD